MFLGGGGRCGAKMLVMRCKCCVLVRACPSVCNKIAKVTSCAHSRCRVPCVRSTDVVGGGCKNQLGERSRRERPRERAKMLVLFSCTPPSSPARLSISGCHRRPAAIFRLRGVSEWIVSRATRGTRETTLATRRAITEERRWVLLKIPRCDIDGVGEGK